MCTPSKQCHAFRTPRQPSTCFLVTRSLPLASSYKNTLTISVESASRCKWTCRRRSESEKRTPKVQHLTRSRAAKRSALYDAMEAYANHFRPLIQAEMEAEQNEFEAQRAALRNSDTKSSSPDMLFDLVAMKQPRIFSSEVYSLGFKNNSNLPRSHTFARGDLIDISLGAADDRGQETIQGTVLSRSSRQLTVTFPRGSDAARRMDILVEAALSLRATRGMSVIAYERATAALDAFVQKGSANPDLVRLVAVSMEKMSTEAKNLFALQNPQGLVTMNESRKNVGHMASVWDSLALESVPGISPTDLSSILKALSGKLNGSQRAAIKRAVRSKLTLVQGPPGTGKTATGAEIISTSLRLGVRRILAVAASNVAVDNLLRKAVEVCGTSFKLVRIGKISSVSEDLWPHSIEGILERRKEVVRMRKAFESGEKPFSDLNGVQKLATVSILQEANVIFSTCVGSGIEEISTLDLDMVIVDEATQATEPDVLIALTCGKSAPRQMVLIGDHHQLPPTVLSAKLGDNGLGLGTSLFLRLWMSGIQSELLNVQYRMHPVINAFPSARFYKRRVKDGVSAEDRILPFEVYSGLKSLHLTSRVVFFPVDDGMEERESVAENGAPGSSLLNRAEADVVVSLVRALTNDRRNSIDVGVISPYSGQVKLLRDELTRKPVCGDIEINTVDGFQGREKDIIIISVVRNNEEGKVGFLSDWRRLNVALTRSRLMLIMVGNERTMRLNAHWKSWITWVHRHGHVVDTHSIKDAA